MYQNGEIAAGGSIAMLPVTGLDWAWFLVGGYMLVAAGIILLRMIPRKAHHESV